MLDEIDPLPSAERHPAVLDRNAEGRRGDHRLDMARHVVGSFFLMGVVAILRREEIERVGEIQPHIRVGILLDRQRCRGMTHEHGEEPILAGNAFEPASKLAGDLDEGPVRALPQEPPPRRVPRVSRPTIGRRLTQNLLGLATVVSTASSRVLSDRSLDHSDANTRAAYSPRGTGWFRKQVGNPAGSAATATRPLPGAPWVSRRSKALFAAPWDG